ncbi:hypothetical protein V6N13_138130 [Hibiscus sabdariffa]
MSSKGTVYDLYQCMGCYLRHDCASFLGTLNTNLKFKKYSKSVDNNVEFFRRGDVVLAELQASVGFKVSSSGMVEGFAQCLGDLSSSDCYSYIGDVVGKPKLYVDRLHRLMSS